jgi:hypothetical protein
MKFILTLISLAIFGFACSSSFADSNPPRAVFNRILNDVSTDNQPTLTGIATDELYAIVSIECRVDGGAFTGARPLEGSFDSAIESFSWRPPRALSQGIVSHEVEVRCRNAAGAINPTFTKYGFYVIGTTPLIGVKSRGTAIGNGDNLASDPSFEVTMISNKPPLFARRSIKEAAQSEAEIQALSLTVNPGNPFIYHGQYDPVLSDGSYVVKFEALDNDGNISVLEVNSLTVQNHQDPSVGETPLNYPNPFDPEDPPGHTMIAYNLTRSADTTLAIFDTLGNQIIRRFYPAGEEGGKAGYNEVPWDGRDEGGRLAGNGLYVFFLNSEGKFLAKGKITVIRR